MERKGSYLLVDDLYKLIGRRTHTNILKGRNVRTDKDGCDNFEDYWTESEDESVCSSYQGLRRRSERVHIRSLLIKSVNDNNKPQSKEKIASSEIPSSQSASNETKPHDGTKYAENFFQPRKRGRSSLKNKNISLKANKNVSSLKDKAILIDAMSPQTLNVSHTSNAVRKELFKDFPIKNNKSIADRGSKSASIRKTNLRKSNRQRYPPFAFWRNERLHYRFEKGGEIKILGVHKGTEEDDGALKSIYKMNSKPKPQKRKKK